MFCKLLSVSLSPRKTFTFNEPADMDVFGTCGDNVCVTAFKRFCFYSHLPKSPYFASWSRGLWVTRMPTIKLYKGLRHRLHGPQHKCSICQYKITEVITWMPFVHKQCKYVARIHNHESFPFFTCCNFLFGNVSFVSKSWAIKATRASPLMIATIWEITYRILFNHCHYALQYGFVILAWSGTAVKGETWGYSHQVW